MPNACTEEASLANGPGETGHAPKKIKTYPPSLTLTKFNPKARVQNY